MRLVIVRRQSDRSNVEVGCYPELTDDLCAEIVGRICSSGEPLVVVLFGSRARNDYKQDSDIDLLIVEAGSASSLQRQRDAYASALRDLYPELTIVVCSPEEMEQWRYVSNYIVTRALSEGRVLYKAAGSSIFSIPLLDKAHLVAESGSHKTQSDLAKVWFRKAEKDFARCARMAQEGDNADYEAACLFAQQSIEKFLKGFLSLQGLVPPKSHDLDALAKACCEMKTLSELDNMDFSTVSKYAIDARYGCDFEPSLKAAIDAKLQVFQVRKVIYQNVPEEAKPE